jgi:hypothetical protein
MMKTLKVLCLKGFLLLKIGKLKKKRTGLIMAVRIHLLSINKCKNHTVLLDRVVFLVGIIDIDLINPTRMTFNFCMNTSNYHPA